MDGLPACSVQSSGMAAGWAQRLPRVTVEILWLQKARGNA